MAVKKRKKKGRWKVVAKSWAGKHEFTFNSKKDAKECRRNMRAGYEMIPKADRAGPLTMKIERA